MGVGVDVNRRSRRSAAPGCSGCRRPCRSQAQLFQMHHEVARAVGGHLRIELPACSVGVDLDLPAQRAVGGIALRFWMLVLLVSAARAIALPGDDEVPCAARGNCRELLLERRIGVDLELSADRAAARNAAPGRCPRSCPCPSSRGSARRRRKQRSGWAGADPWKPLACGALAPLALSAHGHRRRPSVAPGRSCCSNPGAVEPKSSRRSRSCPRCRRYRRMILIVRCVGVDLELSTEGRHLRRGSPSRC